MRSNFITCLISILLLSSCAYDGTVVQKEFRPLPFSESLGIEGIYNFQLRDRAGQIHSQMVTPEVFIAYQVGDYFNDLQLPASVRPAAPSPLMRPYPMRRPLEYYETPYRPRRTSSLDHTTSPHSSLKAESVSRRSAHKPRTLAGTHHKTAHKTKVAKKKHARHSKKIAKTKKHKKTHSKVVRSHRPTPRDPT